MQGERLAIKDTDVFAWVRRFERFPKVQVIDLDAAMDLGDNIGLVRQIAGSLACRVGGDDAAGHDDQRGGDECPHCLASLVTKNTFDVKSFRSSAR